MTEAKFTKGPWRVIFYDCGDRSHYDHNGPCPSIVAPQEFDCGIVHWDGFKQKYWSSANGHQGQIVANAHLISAAPDMYEALEEALSTLDMVEAEVRRYADLYPQSSDGRNTFILLADSVADRRSNLSGPAGLAKARGEQ